MTRDDIPEEVGKFKVNYSLSKLWNYKNYGWWCLFRNPKNGLYAYNEELDEAIWLDCMMSSVKEVKEHPEILEDWTKKVSDHIESLKRLNVIK